MAGGWGIGTAANAEEAISETQANNEHSRIDGSAGNSK